MALDSSHFYAESGPLRMRSMSDTGSTFYKIFYAQMKALLLLIEHIIIVSCICTLKQPPPGLLNLLISFLSFYKLVVTANCTVMVYFARN